LAPWRLKVPIIRIPQKNCAKSPPFSRLACEARFAEAQNSSGIRITSGFNEFLRVYLRETSLRAVSLSNGRFRGDLPRIIGNNHPADVPYPSAKIDAPFAETKPPNHLFHGKPIIGITGGIGSGKSTVAGMFGQMGCLVIDADEQVRQAYQDPAIIEQLQEWWGDEIVQNPGSAPVQVNRKKIADIVFSDPGQKQRLENLLHPKVAELRQQRMADAAGDPQTVAFIWDTPLLFEAGLRSGCDAIVFVESPFSQRLERVQQSRQWDEAELRRREKSQWPLDKKRKISDYIIDNTANADHVRGQVSEVFFRILARRFPE
jgi:dephospho-CoA kinase